MKWIEINMHTCAFVHKFTSKYTRTGFSVKHNCMHYELASLGNNYILNYDLSAEISIKLNNFKALLADVKKQLPQQLLFTSIYQKLTQWNVYRDVTLKISYFFYSLLFLFLLNRFFFQCFFFQKMVIYKWHLLLHPIASEHSVLIS